LTSNASGEITERVFKGQYEISYTCNGERITEMMTIDEVMNLEIVCDGIMTNTVELTDNQLEIYPNPARDQLFIELNQTTATTVKIMDAFGRILSTQALRAGQNSINTKGLNGTYILEVFDGEKVWRERVILIN
ncbi:MAG: T9SS type A sorting domain-containing protein, partial [Bacteroidota bacterium]